MASETQPINSIRFILNILKFIGVFPINLTKNERNNKLFLFQTILFTLCYVVLWCYAFPVRNNEKEIHYILNRMIGVIYLITILMFAWTSLVYKKELRRIVKKFIKFDEICQKNNIIINNKSSQRSSLILILLSSFVLLFIFICNIGILQLYVKQQYLVRWFLIYTPVFVITYYLVFISVIAHLFYERFKGINNVLIQMTMSKMKTNLVQSKVTSVYKDEENKKLVGNLKKLTFLNEELRSLVNDVLSYFSVPILFCFGAIFIDITVQVFYLIFLLRIYEQPNINIEHNYIWQAQLTLVSYICNYLLVILFIVVHFYKTKQEVCTLKNNFKKQIL